VGGKTGPALRRVARYGNGYHGVGSTPAELRAELAAVHEAMERAGRDPGELVVSMLWGFLDVSSRAHLIDMLGDFADAGLHHLVGTPWVDGPPPRGISAGELLTATIENLELFAADVAPAVR